MNKLTGFIEVESGIRIKDTDIWLDPSKKKTFAFISHAHSDHINLRHSCAIVSHNTALLLRNSFKGEKLIEIDWEKPVKRGNIEFELFPAGHILGSAQIMIKSEGIRIVYTGDIKVRPSFTAERIQIKQCDVLIIECTYGNPKYLFPEREQVAEDLIKFVKKCFAKKITHVILAYKTGKAQEVIKILGDAGISVRVEKSIFQVTETYRKIGISLSNYKLFPPFVPYREAIIVPPYRIDLIKPILRKKVVFLSGWALEKKRIEQIGCDVALPLSDHADFSELLAYILKANPKRIYTVHGDESFARYLRKEGFDAIHLDSSYVQPTLWGYI